MGRFAGPQYAFIAGSLDILWNAILEINRGRQPGWPEAGRQAGCEWSPGLGIVETKPERNTFFITVLCIMDTHG